MVTAHGWGNDGLTPADIDDLEQTGTHISDTERRSMMAERDTTDRYLASYLSERVGEEFTGKINGIAKFGMFVKLDDSGADGLVPIRTLGNEYFHFDRDAGTLEGADTGTVYRIGQKVTAKLSQAEATTGGVALELLTVEGVEVVRGTRSPAGRAPRRKAASHKRKTDKTKRKVNRTRS